MNPLLTIREVCEVLKISRLCTKLDVLALARMIGHRDLKMLLRYYSDSADKQDASGHRTEAMLDVYDHSRPVVKPARDG